MKILIADDEPLIRKALVSRLQKCDYTFDEIYQAANGLEAFTLFSARKPDIVITDIRMEQMNGLELAEKCLSLYPAARFIIISGYAEFEYVQKALNLGSISYLLKPITLESLNEALRKAFASLSQTAEINVIKEENTVLLLQNLIQKCREKELDPNEWQQLCRLLGTQPEDRYLIGRWHLTSYSTIHFSCIEEVYTEISRILNRFSEFPFQILPAENKHDKYCIFYGSNVSEDAAAVFLNQFLHRIYLSHIVLTLGLGHAADTIVKNMFLQARQALNLRFENGNGVLYRLPEKPDTEENLKISLFDTQELESKLKYSSSDCQYRLLLQFTEHYTSIIYNFDYLVQAIYELLIRLNFHLDSARWNAFLHQKPWADCENKAEALTLLQNEILTACLENGYSQEPLTYTKLAIHYMEANYQQDISLRFLADELHLNPRYFSTLFKRVEGISPIDYLTNIRIEKAKELLRLPGLPASEISGMVGYNDARYFYKVFKKHTGLSPSEFRIKNTENTKNSQSRKSGK